MQANRSDTTPEPSCCVGARTSDQQIAAGAILAMLLGCDYTDRGRSRTSRAR
jgi:hypothetical protein